jgi:tryptophan-rich sensory protein
MKPAWLPWRTVVAWAVLLLGLAVAAVLGWNAGAVRVP